MSIETDKLLDHVYDGIQEYDNPLPPWWVWLFVITIIWGFGYIVYYHVLEAGPGQEEEYAAEIAQADLLYGNKKQLEENLMPLTDPTSLDAGKDIFIKNCAACHTNDGGGLVGPNLTDEYWIHGGAYEDIVRTTSNGVAEKGMLAWKTTLKPDQIQQVSSFIVTLQGTTPSNPKAPEGEIYMP